MKTIIRVIGSLLVLALSVSVANAQKPSDARMEQDIEIAENVLGTLIKQKFEQQRMFFPLEITGYYQPGYGVTFRIPADYTTPIALGSYGGSNNVIFWNDASGGDQYVTGYEFRDEGGDGSISISSGTPPPARVEVRKPNNVTTLSDKAKEREQARKKVNADSVKNAYNAKVIEAAVSFIVDYGDLISQLAPNERIVVTNQGDQPRAWVGQYFGSTKRTHLSVEGYKSDITAFKTGKTSREQAVAKMTVVNTEAAEKVEPDMELLSSIFSRLYRLDLAKTYFTEDNIYYERLNNFGAIYYMRMYSSTYSNRGDNSHHNLPTLGLVDVDQATRDKKVKEIYPKFEQDLKENILEYGKTVRSLKDDESLIFNVAITRCKGCGIPGSLEASVKSSVLKDFSAGKIDKATALSKIEIKKGANQ